MKKMMCMLLVLITVLTSAGCAATPDAEVATPTALLKPEAASSTEVEEVVEKGDEPIKERKKENVSQL